ncbi:hypothetical protein B0H34DRAFT_677901 [Crassisporium funariophilum]|nr:hypothetical protein B0H34DRAFT_677901 [Crassisporium funariophilum]
MNNVFSAALLLLVASTAAIATLTPCTAGDLCCKSRVGVKSVHHFYSALPASAGKVKLGGKLLMNSCRLVVVVPQYYIQSLTLVSLDEFLSSLTTDLTFETASLESLKSVEFEAA